MLESNEIIKMVGFWFIYPLVVTVLALKIAKFHFEKDIKKQYLLAKDKVANDILNSLSGMLLNMWELVNIDRWIERGQAQQGDQNMAQRRQKALDNFYGFVGASYAQLGQMGLYYGTEIVELVAQLQSEWNEMVNNNDFNAFDNWDDYRRQRILPVLQRIHVELKNTVFERIRSFRLY